MYILYLGPVQLLHTAMAAVPLNATTLTIDAAASASAGTTVQNTSTTVTDFWSRQIFSQHKCRSKFIVQLIQDRVPHNDWYTEWDGMDD